MAETINRSPIVTRLQASHRLQQTKMATLDDVKSLFMEQETKSLSVTHPVTFSGSADENGFNFLRRFEQYCAFNKIEGQSKIQLFALLMRGLASNWYDTLTDDIKKEFKDIKNSFQEHFQSNANTFLNHQKLENVRYDSKCDKPIEQYIETVMTMCNNLNLSDSEKKMALLRGLPASIKADVIGYNPDSVMATIQRLRLVHQGHALKMQEQQEGDNSAIQLASLGAAVANIEKLIKSPNIQSIDRAQNGLNNNSSRFYNSSSMSTMGNNCNGKPKFTGNCFYCGKPGHIARVCFAKQRDSNNRGRFSRSYSMRHRNNLGVRPWLPPTMHAPPRFPPPQGNL